MKSNPEHIHHPTVGHEFGIGHIPDTMTINTPTGKKVFKSASHRKTSLSAALTDLTSGRGNLGQVVRHWKTISHRTRGLGVKSRFMLPLEYRGRSLKKLDKMVDAFNHKEWANDADLLQDLIALRNEAKRHLTSSGKRKLATQTLIDKCNDAIITQQAKGIDTPQQDALPTNFRDSPADSKAVVAQKKLLSEVSATDILKLDLNQYILDNHITVSDNARLSDIFSVMVTGSSDDSIKTIELVGPFGTFNGLDCVMDSILVLKERFPNLKAVKDSAGNTWHLKNISKTEQARYILEIDSFKEDGHQYLNAVFHKDGMSCLSVTGQTDTGETTIRSDHVQFYLDGSISAAKRFEGDRILLFFYQDADQAIYYDQESEKWFSRNQLGDETAYEMDDDSPYFQVMNAALKKQLSILKTGLSSGSNRKPKKSNLKHRPKKKVTFKTLNKTLGRLDRLAGKKAAEKGDLNSLKRVLEQIRGTHLGYNRLATSLIQDIYQMDETEQLDTSQKSKVIALLLQHGSMIKMQQEPSDETKREIHEISLELLKERGSPFVEMYQRYEEFCEVFKGTNADPDLMEKFKQSPPCVQLEILKMEILANHISPGELKVSFLEQLSLESSSMAWRNELGHTICDMALQFEHPFIQSNMKGLEDPGELFYLMQRIQLELKLGGLEGVSKGFDVFSVASKTFNKIKESLDTEGAANQVIETVQSWMRPKSDKDVTALDIMCEGHAMTGLWMPPEDAKKAGRFIVLNRGQGSDHHIKEGHVLKNSGGGRQKRPLGIEYEINSEQLKWIQGRLSTDPLPTAEQFYKILDGVGKKTDRPFPLVSEQRTGICGTLGPDGLLRLACYRFYQANPSLILEEKQIKSEILYTKIRNLELTHTVNRLKAFIDLFKIKAESVPKVYAARIAFAQEKIRRRDEKLSRLESELARIEN